LYFGPRNINEYPYAPISRVVNLAGLATELGAGHVKFDPGSGNQKCGGALRKTRVKYLRGGSKLNQQEEVRLL
jgi:hypothetical protein